MNKTNKMFALNDRVSGLEIKNLRKKLNLTQQEFSFLVNASIKTVEKWEMSEELIKGQIVTLVKILNEYPDLINNIKIEPSKYPLRLWYMFNNSVCTIIDVDERYRKIEIKNYTNDLIYRAFGSVVNPTFENYQEFLESRCLPKQRDKLKIYLKELDLPFYDPFMIIEKTKGRMADDDFWIRIERV